MLATMFNGRHTLKAGADGSYFIDRDGRQFHHILNYLRKACIPPESDAVRAELEAEADFFNLAGLVEILSGHGRFERELGPTNVEMRGRESELRELFAREPSSPLLSDPYLDLIDVFSDLSLWKPARDHTWSELAGEVVLRRVASQVKGGFGASALRPELSIGAHSMANFRTNFTILTDHMLEGFDMSHMVVAGGAVLGSVLMDPDLARRRGSWVKLGFQDADIDCFLYDLTPAQATEKIQAVRCEVDPESRLCRVPRPRDVVEIDSRAAAALCPSSDARRHDDHPYEACSHLSAGLSTPHRTAHPPHLQVSSGGPGWLRC